MRGILILVVVFFALSVQAIEPSALRARQLFEKASVEEEGCIALSALCTDASASKNQVMTAYLACGLMLRAKYLINPYSKLQSFRDGSRLLDRCILDEKDNIEFRYLRFCIQAEAPSFLGYNRNLQEDKTRLLSTMQQLSDRDLRQMIVSFMMHCKLISTTEKQKLQN